MIGFLQNVCYLITIQQKIEAYSIQFLQILQMKFGELCCISVNKPSNARKEYVSLEEIKGYSSENRVPGISVTLMERNQTFTAEKLPAQPHFGKSFLSIK
jgi:hypothetical protein